MTNIIRIPANTQAYLELLHDGLQDVHLIKTMQYRYQNEVPEPEFPAAWAYWKMEETSGTRLDSTDNNRDLVELIMLPQGTNQSDTGIVGTCLKMVAADASYAPYLRWDNGSELTYPSNTPWTFTCWWKGVGYRVNDNAITINFLRYDGEFDIYGLNSDKACIYVGFDGGDGAYYDTYEEEPDNYHHFDTQSWNFFCFTFSGSHFSVHLNNTLLYEQDVTGVGDDPLDWDRVNILSCAGLGNIQWFDEVGLWQVALTTDQRTQLYNSGAGWSPY